MKARLSRLRKSHVGMGLGSIITLTYILAGYGLLPFGIVTPSAIIGVPLLAVAAFLLAVLWMIEEEARAIAARRPEAVPLALECRVLAMGSLVYFSLFFGLWAVLDSIDATLGWHHFLLIVLFLGWEIILSAYGYRLKRRLTPFGGTPFWWWRTPAGAQPATAQE